jgi:hypothetical protein
VWGRITGKPVCVTAYNAERNELARREREAAKA